MSIKVRGDLRLVDNFLTAVVLLQICKLVSPQVKVFTAVNGCNSYIYGFPSISLCVPFISSKLNTYCFRTRIISITFIVPINRHCFIGQNDITRNNSAVLITCRIVLATQILGCITILVVLGNFIIVRNSCCVGNCCLIQVSLTILPHIGPYIAILRYRTYRRACADRTFANDTQRLFCHLNTISVQVQGYCLRTHTIIVTFIIPLNRELNVIASRDESMIKLNVAGITSYIVIDGIFVCRIGCFLILGRSRAFNLTGRCCRVMNRMLTTIRILIADHNQLIGDFLNRCISRGCRQIRKRVGLRPITIVINGGFSNQLIVYRRYQTQRYAGRSTTVIVINVFPVNGCSKIIGLFLPYCIQIKNPIVFIRCNITAITTGLTRHCRLDQIGNTGSVCSILSCPTHELLTGCARQWIHQFKQVVIIIRLSTNETGSFAGIIVIYPHLLSRPLCIIGSVFCNLRISRQRRGACLISVPTRKSISLSGRSCRQLNRFIILLSDCTATSTAIGIPCDFIRICFPNAIYGVLRRVRLPTLIYIRLCCVRSCCPAFKGVAFSRRILRELERKLCGVFLGLTIHLDRPLEFTSCAISRCDASAFEIIVKISDIHIAVAHLRRISALNDGFPLCVINLIIIIRDGYVAGYLIAPCWSIIPSLKLKGYITRSYWRDTCWQWDSISCMFSIRYFRIGARHVPIKDNGTHHLIIFMLL